MNRRLGLLVSLLALGLGAGPVGAEGPAKIKFKLGSIAPSDSPWDEALTDFKRKLDASNGGTLQMQLYLGGKLGSETDLVKQVKFGSTECIGVSNGALATLVPSLEVFELPFLWDNEKEVYAALKLLTPYFQARFKEKGLHLVGWSENGWRNFMTAGKPIETVADLSGAKMRSQENAMYVAFWNALGAKPVPLPTSEFDKAMKEGLITGADQSVVITAAFGWMNSIKSYTVSRHIYQPAVIVCNQEWYSKLTPEQQKTLDSTMVEIEASVRQKLGKSEREFLEIFRGKGIAVTELSDAARTDFIAKTASVRKKYGKSIPPEVLKLVEKAKAEN